MTAPDDSAHGNVDESHFESHKIQVHCNEADVGFSFSSAGKTSPQSNWFELDEGYQVMLPVPGGQTDQKDMCEGLECGKAEGKPWSVLVARLVCTKFRVARLAVEATPNSETDFDVNATQLEESEGKHADSNTRHYHAT